MRPALVSRTVERREPRLGAQLRSQYVTNWWNLTRAALETRVHGWPRSERLQNERPVSLDAFAITQYNEEATH